MPSHYNPKAPSRGGAAGGRRLLLLGALAALCAAPAPDAQARLYVHVEPGQEAAAEPGGWPGAAGLPDGGAAAAEPRPVDRSRVHVLPTDRSVAESIEAWALAEGWRIRWEATMPPIRPRRTTRYFGSVDHPDGALAMVLDRISPIVDLSAEVHPEDRVIAIREWRAPKWEGQEFRLVDPETGMTLDF